MSIAEADFEAWVLEMLAEQGWQTVHGPEIAPGIPGAEREDYRERTIARALEGKTDFYKPWLPVLLKDNTANSDSGEDEQHGRDRQNASVRFHDRGA